MVCLRIEQSGFIVGDENADGERTEDVEENDTPEDSAYGFGDVFSRIFCLACCHGYHLHAAVCKGCIYQSREEAKESSGTTGTDVCLHSAWVVPVAKAEPVVGRPSAKVDDKGEEEKTDDRYELDTGEDKFGFSVN